MVLNIGALRSGDFAPVRNEIAELAGIEPSYADYFGRGVAVSADTKRALLRALGFGVDSPADVAASLAPYRRVFTP